MKTALEDLFIIEEKLEGWSAVFAPSVANIAINMTYWLVGKYELFDNAEFLVNYLELSEFAESTYIHNTVTISVREKEWLGDLCSFLVVIRAILRQTYDRAYDVLIDGEVAAQMHDRADKMIGKLADDIAVRFQAGVMYHGQITKAISSICDLCAYLGVYVREAR